MFCKRKFEERDPIKERREELTGEVRRWYLEIQQQIEVVLAQHKMTLLFPTGSPDDEATHFDLEEERTHLRNMVAEYDYARAVLIKFAKEHPEIPCGTFEDSHKMMRRMLMNKK